MIQQAIVPTSSPCGRSNCSYEIEINGPTFKCSKSTNLNSTMLQAWKKSQDAMDALTNSIVDGTYLNGTNLTRYAFPIISGKSYTAKKSDAAAYELDLEFILQRVEKVGQWRNWGNSTTLRCTAGYGKYVVHTTYINNGRALEIRKPEFVPISAGDVGDLTLNRTESAMDDPLQSAIWTDKGRDSYSRMNALSIAKALGSVFQGNVSIFNMDLDVAGGTMILDSPLTDRNASSNFLYEPNYHIDPSIMEEMLQNLTVSMISLGRWNTTTTVSQSNNKITYTFSKRVLLIVPYASTLVVSLVFVILGNIVLAKHEAFEGKGFVDIVAATAYSPAIRSATASGSAGTGYKKLKNLRLRFGELVGPENANRQMGFGAQGELKVTSLKH